MAAELHRYHHHTQCAHGPRFTRECRSYCNTKDYDEWLLCEGPPPTHLLRPFPAEMSMRFHPPDLSRRSNLLLMSDI